MHRSEKIYELLRSYRNKLREYNGRRTLKHGRCSNRNGAPMVYVKLARGSSGW